MILRIELTGLFNSFRVSNFHTYHKSVGFPPKTTVAGMFGAAIGITPEEVNTRFLLNNKFKIGIKELKEPCEVNDLWKIRKIKKESSDESTSDSFVINGYKYYSAVIIREILYNPTYLIFVTTEDPSIDELKEKLLNPKWALSLGREDELILIKNVEIVDYHKTEEKVSFISTVIPATKYNIDFDANYEGRILGPPQIVKLPMSFTYEEEGLTRTGNIYETFIFSRYMKVFPIDAKSDTYVDDNNNHFQLF
jgi:CRISPR-associated protein Cas5 subtype I-B